jgi:hypothetical protein
MSKKFNLCFFNIYNLYSNEKGKSVHSMSKNLNFCFSMFVVIIGLLLANSFVNQTRGENCYCRLRLDSNKNFIETFKNNA